MTAWIIKEFADRKMEMAWFVFNDMWLRGETYQLDIVCYAMMQKDIREKAEADSMRLKVNI